jgi:2-amino-4-hydroxy-6-hydroxymethyldihydropteridine diphosphokinase
MAGHTVYIGLGSNQGESLLNLRLSIRIIAETSTVVAISALYRTEPQDQLNQPDFWNAVIQVQTMLDPLKLLSRLQRIEQNFGRVSDPANPKGPRVIDLDILLFDSLILPGPALILPHPQIQLRRFVLEPLLEIDPDLTHPKSGLPLASFLPLVAGQGIYEKHPATYNHPDIWLIDN